MKLKESICWKAHNKNHQSTEDSIYILDIFLTENNCLVKKLTDNKSNKIKITFYQEDIVFNFTKKWILKMNVKIF